jgi:hypothetical protein
LCKSWPDRNRETSMGSVMVIMRRREREREGHEERRKELRVKRRAPKHAYSRGFT